mmetsp:Transcript_1500/g.6558  ORF Transcript_1500/g.6558 Transcript_1500/m.6558 type:complete len:306 (-) Transcript_1500:24-941(-)
MHEAALWRSQASLREASSPRRKACERHQPLLLPEQGLGFSHGLGRLAQGRAGVEQDEPEHRLGRQVQDGVEDRLKIRGDRTLTLGEDPHDGIPRPQDDGHVGQELVDARGVLAARAHERLRGAAHAREEAVDDRDVEERAHRPEVVLVGVRHHATEDAGNDHEHVEEHEHGGLLRAEDREAAQVHEQKWRGEDPIDVAHEVEGAVVHEHVAMAGGHVQIRERGHAADDGGDGVEEAASRLLGTVKIVEVQHGKEHAPKRHPQGGVSDFGHFGNHGRRWGGSGVGDKGGAAEQISNECEPRDFGFS